MLLLVVVVMRGELCLSAHLEDSLGEVVVVVVVMVGLGWGEVLMDVGLK